MATIIAATPVSEDFAPYSNWIRNLVVCLAAFSMSRVSVVCMREISKNITRGSSDVFTLHREGL
jgi:hypothetical protein